MKLATWRGVIRAQTSVLGVSALLCAAATAAAQVKPPTAPIPQAQAPQQKAAPLPVSLPDLALEQVQASWDDDEHTKTGVPKNPHYVAVLSVRNTGPAPAVLKAGQPVARGDAAQPGKFAFPAASWPSDFTLPPGGETTITLTTGDACALGAHGPVTFKVDPDNHLREGSKNNNAVTLPDVGFPADAAATAGIPDNAGGGTSKKASYLSAGVPSALLVTVVIGGAAAPGVPALVCAGEVTVAEVSSPLAPKYGLRSQTNQQPALNPGKARALFSFPIAASDLPPGSYTWKLHVTVAPRLTLTSPADLTVTATFK